MSSGTAEERDYVTARVGPQLVGIPIGRVRDVFVANAVTPVPLAGDDVAGVLNLRGRIVTLIDLRRHLAMEGGGPGASEQPVAIGIDDGGDSYGLLVDCLDEVRRFAPGERQDNPVHLDAALARVSAGVHHLEDELVVLLDMDRILETMPPAEAPPRADGPALRTDPG